MSQSRFDTVISAFLIAFPVLGFIVLNVMMGSVGAFLVAASLCIPTALLVATIGTMHRVDG
jgi:hypothetical protein